MTMHLIIAAFLFLMIMVGVLTSRKVKTADDYVIGGRRTGSWLSAFSYGTTYFSSVVFVGYDGRFNGFLDAAPGGPGHAGFNACHAAG